MKKPLLIITLFLISVLAKAQPFADEIVAFQKQDSISFPAPGQILFVGSSSFTLWKDVQTYFPEYKILNRGFGGSSLPDLIRYADKIIIPYHPKQIVIYCGENDIANDSTVTGKTVFLRFKKLYRLIRNKLGNVPVAYISMKPSPSRWHLRQKMTDGNKRIERFMNKSVRNCRFISVWNKMLSNQGEPDPDIFLQDRLHLNKKGYVLWQTIIQPFLIK